MAMTMEQWRAKYGSHGLTLMVEAVEESSNNGSPPSEGTIYTLVAMAKELSEALQSQAAPPRDDLSDGLREVWSAMPAIEPNRVVTLAAEATNRWEATILIGSQYQSGVASTPQHALTNLAHQIRVYREEQGL